MTRLSAWLALSVIDVLALPIAGKRQLNLFGGVLPAASVTQAQASQQQQQALARLGALQVSENVYRIQPTDPAATYSSALIIFMPKEQGGAAGDLAKLIPVIAGTAPAAGKAQAQAAPAAQAAQAAQAAKGNAAPGVAPVPAAVPVTPSPTNNTPPQTGAVPVAQPLANAAAQALPAQPLANAGAQAQPAVPKSQPAPTAAPAAAQPNALPAAEPVPVQMTASPVPVEMTSLNTGGPQNSTQAGPAVLNVPNAGALTVIPEAEMKKAAAETKQTQAKVASNVALASAPDADVKTASQPSQRDASPIDPSAFGSARGTKSVAQGLSDATSGV